MLYFGESSWLLPTLNLKLKAKKPSWLICHGRNTNLVCLLCRKTVPQNMTTDKMVKKKSINNCLLWQAIRKLVVQIHITKKQT